MSAAEEKAETLKAQLDRQNDRQKSLHLETVLLETCAEVEQVMSPAAVLSGLMMAYVRYGSGRLPAYVLRQHLALIIERLALAQN